MFTPQLSAPFQEGERMGRGSNGEGNVVTVTKSDLQEF